MHKNKKLMGPRVHGMEEPLGTLEKSSHIINQTNMDIIISSILWNPITFPNGFKIGDEISSKATCHLASLTWIYEWWKFFQTW
jgi:hypothetical protein